ncbi:hypothetical protein PPACK8108_LOCUS23137, partial [Phakopsora pachyrhizi]
MFQPFKSLCYSELPVKDQYDIFNVSLEKYVTYYKYHMGGNLDSTLELNGICKALDFFQMPHALNKLSNLSGLSHSEQELTKSVARTLINIVSVPEYLDSTSCVTGIWSFAYYIIEFLMANKDSRFLELYQDQIQHDSLIEKIDFLKKCIALKNAANELIPSTLTIKKREFNKVWEQLGEEKIVKWFEQYSSDINAIDGDLKAQSNQIEDLKNYENSVSHADSCNVGSKEYIASKLGALLKTKIIKHFLRRFKEKSTLEEAKLEKHFEILNIAAKRRFLELKEQKKKKERRKKDQRFRIIKN